MLPFAGTDRFEFGVWSVTELVLFPEPISSICSTVPLDAPAGISLGTVTYVPVLKTPPDSVMPATPASLV